MWSEWVDATNSISRVWPRAAAVSENLWAPADGSNPLLSQFAARRMAQWRCRLLLRGIAAEPIEGGMASPDLDGGRDADSPYYCDGTGLSPDAVSWRRANPNAPLPWSPPSSHPAENTALKTSDEVGRRGPVALDLRKLGGRTVAEAGRGFLNTAVFESAVRTIHASGGGSLYVPPGEWQTTGFALTSHMTLFIESGATINMLANISCDSSNKRCSAAHWRPRNDSCPSYPADVGPKDAAAASGVDERHSGYEPLLGAWNATDIIITGNNGTIQGNGPVWWPQRAQLIHGRPHMMFFSRCSNIHVSNLTLRSSPFWTVRFWDSGPDLSARNLTILATCASENNDGVDIDSSHGATVEDLYYDGCDDGVALKSGLDGKTRAGTEFGVPTRDVTIRRIVAKTRSACITIGTGIPQLKIFHFFPALCSCFCSNQRSYVENCSPSCYLNGFRRIVDHRMC